MSITWSATLEEFRAGGWRLVSIIRDWSNWGYITCPIGGYGCGHDGGRHWCCREEEKPVWHGRGIPEDRCRDEGLEDYFDGQSWWTPEEGSSSWLTADELEQAIALALEWARRWPEVGEVDTVERVDADLAEVRATLAKMREIELAGRKTRIVFGLWR